MKITLLQNCRLKSYGFLRLTMIILLALSLISCTKGKDQKNLNIVFVQSWADAVNPLFESIALQWGELNDVTVEVDIIPIRELDLKTTTWLQAPYGDLALIPQSIAMVNINKLHDVSKLNHKIIASVTEYYDIGEAMAQIGGKWYNVPYFAWPHVWFYRKDILEAANADLPSDLYEAGRLAKLLSRPNESFYGLGIGLGQDEDFSMFLQTIMWSFGASVVSTDGTTVTLESDSMRDCVRFIVDLYEAKAIPPGALGWDAASNNNYFLGKKIAMTANALSIDYVAKRREPELYSSIVHSPYPPGPAGQYSFVQSFGWVLKSKSPNKDIAENFLFDFYSSSDFHRLFEISEGAIAPLQKIVGNSEIWASGQYTDAIMSVESAKPLGWPGPFTRQAAEVFNRRILNNIFARILNDKLSIDEAIKEAAQEIRRVYSQ